MPEIISGAVHLSSALIGLAYIFSVIRLILGPSLPDRVVALDLIAALTLGFTALHALRTGEWAFLSVSVIITLICFLGTIAFAQYLEKKTQQSPDE